LKRSFHVTFKTLFNVFRFHPAGEIMVKRENDPWIIAKRSDMRELLVVVNQKNANLKEISGRSSLILNFTKKEKIQF
jgi:hypothetical protein